MYFTMIESFGARHLIFETCVLLFAKGQLID